MITVNGDPLKHKPGMTVRDILKERGYVFPLLVVRINGALIARDDFDRAQVPDEADVQVIHLMSGG
ncbi:MAG: sulfur carrier protein ThiS [Deltaproteobacteria bacterium]|nr:sulfur carrier protein ThiS [Deltaproteobacteria bacterium]